MCRLFTSFLSDRITQIGGIPLCFRLSPVVLMKRPLPLVVPVTHVFDVLEDCEHMIVCADDIFVYTVGPNEFRTRGEFNNILSRISCWCSANKL